jgi:2-succinyl-6-hydroxy-2,4-cyclohexadiene-1-carboxylate synthase
MLEPLKPIALAGESTNPTLLLFHGFMGSIMDWQSMTDALGDSHYVLGVNLPGHGEGWNDHPVDTCDMATCAAALNDHLDSMGLGSCALLGYSMGGRFALYLAVNFPERYTRVVLESASPGLDSDEKQATRRTHDEHLAHRLAQIPPGNEDYRAFLEEWYDLPLFDSLRSRPDLRKKLIDRRMERNNPRILADSLRALGTGSQPNLWPDLANSRTPTLLLVGEQDRKYRIIAEKMCAACPAMAMEVFVDCGHIVHLENPEAMVTTVRSFLHTR